MQILTHLATTFLGALGISMLTMTQLVGPWFPYHFHSHLKPVPRLGEIAIFISFILASAIGLYNLALPEFNYIIIATMVIFFKGLKDDILPSSLIKNIIYRLLMVFLLIFPAKIRITGLHGLFGLNTIGINPGALITCILIIFTISLFSLIHQIYGHATRLSTVVALVLGCWFAVRGRADYAILSFALVGSIAGFSLYNYYDKQNIIAMGNTGAIFMGMIISLLITRANEFAIYKLPNSGFLAVMILLPIFSAILIISRAELVRHNQLINKLEQDRERAVARSYSEITSGKRLHLPKRDNNQNAN